MPVQLGSQHPRRYVLDGGTKVSVGVANVATTGLVEGSLYRITMIAGNDVTPINGGAVFAWGTADAADTTGSFDFALATGESVVVEAQNDELNIIGADGTTVGAVYLQRLDTDY